MLNLQAAPRYHCGKRPVFFRVQCPASRIQVQSEGEPIVRALTKIAAIQCKRDSQESLCFCTCMHNSAESSLIVLALTLNQKNRSIRTDKRHLKIGVWRLADFLGAQNALLSGDAIAAKHRVRDSPSALLLNFRATDLDDISCPPIYTIWVR